MTRTRNDENASKDKRGRLNLYLTQARADAFERAFDLLKQRGLLTDGDELDRSRTKIIDAALEALITELTRDEM